MKKHIVFALTAAIVFALFADTGVFMLCLLSSAHILRIK